MNTINLHAIFVNYIKKFELINNPEYNENYKWKIAAKFHDLIDPASPRFKTGIGEAWKLSDNLIDSVNRYCFSALVTCVQKDEEAVRAIFRDLFAYDGGDLAIRQEKILAFIAKANELTAKHHSTNGMFMNDQRSAMAYLFLNDPDNHYLYKYTEAFNVASCIEYFDDWGSGPDFRLDVYYRMCDLIVEEIRKDDALLKTHQSRFYDSNGNLIPDMYPDKNYHILTFDIIYGAPGNRYNFYDGIPFSPITTSARKLHEERLEKAKMLYAQMEKARLDAELYREAVQYYAQLLPVGGPVTHKTFGSGTVISYTEGQTGDTVKVRFESTNDVKSFAAANAILGGFLLVDAADICEKNAKYKEIISKNNLLLQSALKKAEQDFEPYKDCLE